MNDLNFDGFKNLKTPDNWIEKAVDIPSAVKPGRFGLKLSLTAAAASVVLVTAVIISLSIRTGDKPFADNTGQNIIKAEETVPTAEPYYGQETKKQNKKTDAGTPQSAAQSSRSGQGYLPKAEGGNLTGNTAAADIRENKSPAEKKHSGTRETVTENKSTLQTEPEAPEPGETQPAETTPGEQPPTEPVADNYYRGSLKIYYSSGSFFYYSDNTYIHITQNGTEFSEKYSDAERATVTAVDSPDGREVKQAEFTPKDNGIYLMNNEPYTVEVYNEAGNSQTFNTRLGED